MKFRKFVGVSKTQMQAYYKDGVELLYPDQNHPLKLAILPAFDPNKPTDPTSYIKAVGDNGEESDFYTIVRAAKFVGHGNRRAKISFLSPRTFDENADDPYEAFYEWCSKSDRWSYLTKDGRKTLTGEVEGAIIPRVKSFFVANVMDISAGSRGGVFVTELSESVAKSILYSVRKNGSEVAGLAFERTPNGELVFGDITDPKSALAIEVVWSGKGYVARPITDKHGATMRVEIPDVLLQHRMHMEDPETFLIRPQSGQEIVDRLANLLRGYRSESGHDEIEALREAMDSIYGKGTYFVDEKQGFSDTIGLKALRDAAKEIVEANPEEKADAVEAAVERGVEKEKYTPVNPKPVKTKRMKPKPLTVDDSKVVPMTADPYRDEPAPGEDIDPSDIAALRTMLSGGKK